MLVVSLIETSHHMAYDDPLTGLPGRRALDEALVRLGGRYAIAMVDIDHFKRFNDEHGHDAGDQLLRMLATKLSQIEGGGRPFRYGGEEFAGLFPGPAGEAALPHIESLRHTVGRAPFTVRGRGRTRTQPTTPPPPVPRRRLALPLALSAAAPGA